jgi:small conductance mechanosensitive channel
MKEQLLSQLETIGTFSGIIILTLVIGYLFSKIFSRFIHKSSIALNNDPTNYKFLGYMISAMIYIVGFSLAIYKVDSLRAVASSMLAGAGIFALAIGLASQQALSNVVSGIFIIIFKPFRLGDRLKIRDNLAGIVEDITLRHTVILDFENKRIIIPNSVISDEVITNSDFIDDKICRWVDMSISYDSDVKKAKKIMEEEVLKHPLHIDPRNNIEKENGEPIVSVRVLSLTDFSVNLRAWAWAVNSSDAFAMGCDLLESIKERFEAEGIEIPFPHRTIIYKNEAKRNN